MNPSWFLIDIKRYYFGFFYDLPELLAGAARLPNTKIQFSKTNDKTL
jgi:hypothetical protein